MNFDDPREVRLRALELAMDRRFLDEEGRTRMFCVADVVEIAGCFFRFIVDGDQVPAEDGIYVPNENTFKVHPEVWRSFLHHNPPAGQGAAE